MKKIIFLFGLAVLMANCSDSLLDTELITEKVNSNFYSSPDDVEKALMGIYSDIAPVEIPEFSFVTAELMSDDRLPGGGPDDTHAHAIGKFANNSNDMYLGAWTRNYEGIFRANMLIESLDQVKFISVEQAAKAEGEAHFMRAYYYFDLAKMFGNVPLVVKPVPMNLPKAETDELYAQIASDLKIAIEKLPSNAYSVNDIGRATKWAAQGYMARVFLFYTGLYNKESLPLAGGGNVTKQQAIDYVDDCVLNSGHKLVPDFRNLWPYSYSNTDYAYAKDNSLSWVGEEGGNTEAMFAIRYSNRGNWSYTNTTNQMVLYFGWREQVQVPFGQGWGWGPINPNLWNEWPDADIRKKGSICNVDDAAEGISGYEWGNDHQLHESGFWQKKYMPINILNNDEEAENMSISLYGAPADFMLNNTQETVLLRLADVLLMGAELGSAKKQVYLDQVRTRVNLPSVSVTLDNIKKERRFELAFEGLRYYDLLRWGTAETEINKKSNLAVKNENKPAVYTTKFRPETKGFLPIPESQIQLSQGVLIQNEGW